MSCILPSLYDTSSSLLDNPDFSLLCSLFDDIRRTQDDKGAINGTIKSIKRALNRLLNAEFEVTILDNSLSSDTFVCNVYPTVLEAKKIVDLIIEEHTNEINTIRDMWASKIKTWHVDLDSKIFFDQGSSRLDSVESVVLVLYNIERTLYSFDNITRVNYLVNKRFYQSNFTINKLARSIVCRNLFLLPFIQSCEYKNYYTIDGSNKDKLEGSFILRPEMPTIYTNALTKYLFKSGSSCIDRSSVEFDAEITTILNWIFMTIGSLQYSTKDTKKDLKNIILNTKSYYAKNIYVDILLTFGTYQAELSSQGKDFVKEHFNTLGQVPQHVIDNKTIAIEKNKERQIKAIFEKSIKSIVGDFLDSFGNIRRISQKELDVLKIEIDGIQNSDDKMYILDDLYEKISLVDYSLSSLENKELSKKVKMSKATLLDMQSQLKELRDSVMKKDIKPKQLGLYIKYPNGYEG